MVQVIKQYQGTIDEFIGDAIFVLFGALIWHDDDAERASLRAVAMQLAAGSVNEQNRSEELPEVEGGIGINTGQVVVGNVGSPERMKYGVVGSQVNLTSRIQSCTTGGQILVSEATRREVAHSPDWQLDGDQGEGHRTPRRSLRDPGHGRAHTSCSWPMRLEVVVPLPEAVPFRYAVVEGDQVQRELLSGALEALAEAGRGACGKPTSHVEQSQDDHRRGWPRGHGALMGRFMGTLPGAAGKSRFASRPWHRRSRALRGLIKKQASESVSAADPGHSGKSAEPL